MSRLFLHVFILCVSTIVLLAINECQGYSVSAPHKQLAKTFSGDEGEGEGGGIKISDYTSISLILWPVIIIMICAIIIPVALVMIVIIVIPVLAGEEEEKSRSLRQSSMALYDWSSVYLTQTVLNGTEQCMERISCELAKVGNAYSSPLTNRIQKKIAITSALSDDTKSRLGRSFDVAGAVLERSQGSCSQFKCKPWNKFKSSKLLHGVLSLVKDSSVGRYVRDLGSRLVYRKRNTRPKVTPMLK